MPGEDSTKPDKGGASTTTKRRRSNVNKACENCRRRRCKCDGIMPVCTTCKIYKDECYWDPREDYRKPLSRSQVQALVTRVQDLERLLKDNGIDPGQGSGSGLTSEHQEKGGEHDDEVVDGEGSDLREWSQDHLVEAESGDYQVHGPTSAFRHLSKYSIDQHTRWSPEEQIPQDLQEGFAKYLPTEVYLSQEQHDIVLDRFFRYFANWGLRSHPILFQQDMALALGPNPPPRTHHYSPMLHNAILAIALGFSDEPYLRETSVRKIFAKRAKCFHDSEGMNPTVATVQALAHLASYHSVVAEHNLGWLYIGTALRCVVALGLNMDDSRMLKNGNISESEALARNVTFWTTFIQEGVWAPYIGRPISLPDFTAHAPVIEADLDQYEWDNKTAVVLDSPLLPQPSMISTVFGETVKLMRIGERIMNTLYGIKTDMATLIKTGVISEISLALSTWLESLPPSLVLHSNNPKNGLPHILMLHLAREWLVILLHRPFYRPLAGLPPGTTPPSSSASSLAAWAVKQCDRAALQSVVLLQTFHRLHDLRFTPPTAMQCCFVAGTTHLLALASSRTPTKQRNALAHAQECIRLLGLISVSTPAAKQKQVLLENLLSEYGTFSRVRKERSASPKEEIKLENPLTTIPELQAQVPILSSTFGYESVNLPISAFIPPHASSAQIPNYPFTPWPMQSMPNQAISSAQINYNPYPLMPQPMAIPTQPTNIPQPTIPNVTSLEAQFNTFDFNSLPPPLHDDYNFGTSPLDPETQALLDNILQPHLNIGMGGQFTYGGGFLSAEPGILGESESRFANGLGQSFPTGQRFPNGQGRDQGQERYANGVTVQDRYPNGVNGQERYANGSNGQERYPNGAPYPGDRRRSSLLPTTSLLPGLPVSNLEHGRDVGR